MDILRLEDIDARGVYSSGVWWTACGTSIGQEHQPAPYYDTALESAWNALEDIGQNTKYYFGFSNTSQLLNWFQDNLQLLYDLGREGIYLSRYRATQYFSGHTQVIFCKETAQLLERIHMRDWINQRGLL